MPALLSLTKKQNFTSAEVTVPVTGQVQLFARGMGSRGRVLVLLKGAGGDFHNYRELTFSGAPTAQSISLQAGDKLKVQCVSCSDAAVELRQ